MERESREKQSPIEFRCRKILSDVGKSSDVSPAAIKNIQLGAGDDSGNTITSPTPEKSDRKLSTKGKPYHDNSSQSLLSENLVPEITLKSTELPEKLKSLADLFDRMTSSVRLLGLRKRLSSFRNISTQVEILTRRKFSYGHLAQMKYVFPDAIQIEKVLIHDERSLCMIPDLKVTVLFDIIGCPYPGQSTSMALCHAFRVRLLEQYNTNQDAEIPEAVLPEPFSLRNDIEYLDRLSEESPDELPEQASTELDPFLRFSHFSPAFRKKFCEKRIVPEAERTKVLASASLSISDGAEVKTSGDFDIPSLPDVKSFSKAIHIPSHDQLRTPVKGASTACDAVAEFVDNPSGCNAPQSCQSTPAHVDPVTCDVIAETPVMPTPKRPIMSPAEILVGANEKTVNETNSTPSVRRTLLFSPQKLDFTKSKIDFDIEEQTQVHELPSDETFSNNRSICAHEKNITSDAPSKSNEAGNLIRSKSEKRQALSDSLPAMFDTVHFICQSVGCSLITKQELVHKIISNNLDIEETSELEEQLGLLEEFVPDWMCKESTCNGEFLYRIRGLPDLNTVRVRLSEAARR